MTHSNRNFVLAYVLLVALPLLGLGGVLHSGRKLSAPMSVGGVWKINVNQDQLNGFPCGRSVLVQNGQNGAFSISQSGKAFALNTASAAFSGPSGTIEGTAIRATLIPSGGEKEGECSEPSLTLTARIDGKATPRTMQGSLTCPGCVTIEFQGVRDEQAGAKEIH